MYIFVNISRFIREQKHWSTKKWSKSKIAQSQITYKDDDQGSRAFEGFFRLFQIANNIQRELLKTFNLYSCKKNSADRWLY